MADADLTRYRPRYGWSLLRTPDIPAEVTDDLMHSWPERNTLALPARDYQVGRAGEDWTVTVIKTGEQVYSGPGPIAVVPCPVPF
ncbi:hypothetical protein [uncultured Xylophilus sp.]|uniref:hypothetical protein n=1 Tax=uncultured Xylophilus sp. TaxID=296832 RepID=UPI0025F26B75|nr:hypothetical protein [uncultured Xylophilus sp.]